MRMLPETKIEAVIRTEFIWSSLISTFLNAYSSSNRRTTASKDSWQLEKAGFIKIPPGDVCNTAEWLYPFGIIISISYDTKHRYMALNASI